MDLDTGVALSRHDDHVDPFPVRRAEPAHAVPAGRMGYDLGAERLLLHTVQSAEAFESLLTTGTLRPDPELAEEAFTDAYEWIHRMMAARLPTRGEGALWFWARTRRKHLVDTCRRSRGRVLLTCRVPRERVLLSHFDEWHLVLNKGLGMPRLPGESEDDAFARWEEEHDDFDARLRAAGMRDAPVRDWPADLRTEIEKSWESIFDRGNYGPFECWQGTTHALNNDEVLEAVRII
ncbi:DUF3841 domain-containing protein [Actinomadura sp. NPDC049753]|uniref:DUF3841 domain-containing protein n=1 Tax=Actinomadura sp. NPDC049753 TaxID=3154739 RepID=UPI0034195B44